MVKTWSIIISRRINFGVGRPAHRRESFRGRNFVTTNLIGDHARLIAGQILAQGLGHNLFDRLSVQFEKK